jgi:tetratricopeptide (TPR) repeat protein
MSNTDRNLRVFLCHTSQDKPVIRELYQRLLAEGWIDPWLDVAKLLPGQHWTSVIQESLNRADVVIVAISDGSTNKEGFVQREMNYAWDRSLEKPRHVIYLIPLRVEDCDVPYDFREKQWADYFGDKKEETYTALLESMKLRHEQKLRQENEENTRKETENKIKREAAEIKLPPLVHSESDVAVEITHSPESESNDLLQFGNETNLMVVSDISLPDVSVKKNNTRKVKRRKRKKVEQNDHSLVNDSQDVMYYERMSDWLYLAQVNMRDGCLRDALGYYYKLAQEKAYLGIVTVTVGKIVEDHPDNLLAWEILGIAYSGLNRRVEAKHAFEKANKPDPL